MAEPTEQYEPRIYRKAFGWVLIWLMIAAAGLAYATFDTRTDPSIGVVLAVIGVFYVLLHADRKFVAWLHGWRWSNDWDRWPWTVLGLDGLRLFYLGVGILLIVAGIVIYVKPLL